MQNYHNLIAREDEREMIPYCNYAGVGLVPWSPVARGVLARPWGASSLRGTTDSRLEILIRSRETDSDKEIVNRVEELAKKKGVSMAQIAIAWSLSHQGINPVVGLNSKQRVDDAVRAVQVRLTADEVKHLEEPYIPKGISVLER